jgi:hypothetical protein
VPDKPKPKPPKPKHVPVQPEPPRLEKIVFTFVPLSHGRFHVQVVGTVVPSPATTSDQDTDLSVIVVLNSAAPITLDAGAPPGVAVTFDCNSGDTYSITQTDTNADGTSIPSVPLTGTVPTFVTPPTTVPGQPGVPTVSFAPAPV